MKVVFLLGAGAVGKMTVGQALAKETDFTLFHNHLIIEPVLEVFKEFKPEVIGQLRQVIFQELAKGDLPGLILTFMMDYNSTQEWIYFQSVVDIFSAHQIFVAELIADQATRLERNNTPNRLEHKKSKRDLSFSSNMIRYEDEHYRLVSKPGEFGGFPFIQIDNSHLAPEKTAGRIIQEFKL